MRTGNYPGVTVEQRIGKAQWFGRKLDLIDLPGTYSLSPKSPDEMVAVQVLTGCCDEPKPDLIVCICNASALERNLYLATQVLEVNCPVILCLNMWDAAVHEGIQIDTESLSRELGVPVITTSATRREGLDALKSAIVKSLETSVETAKNQQAGYPNSASILTGPVVSEIERLEEVLAGLGLPPEKRTPFLVARSLLDPGGSVERLLTTDAGENYRTALEDSRKHLAAAACPIPGIEAQQRYRFINQLLSRVQKRTTAASSTTLTDRLDSILTHRVFGLVICLAVLLFVFSTIYWFSQPVSEGVEAVLGWVSAQIQHSMAPGPLRSLLTEGIVAGVGSVLVFLPQICLLFLFIALLEDCGYMARAAFMMDRLMSLLGLSGRSFLPLMSSFACAVPGVMATRVIDDRRDRFVTILIAPLMSCSARLPVYVLMIGAFIPDTRLLGGWLPLRAVVLFAMSTLGLVVAVPVALILRKMLFRGEPSPFLLELPDYRLPSPRVVAHRIWESGLAFVVRAGTLIFATSVLVWAAGTFPGNHATQYELTAKIESLQADEEANAEQIAVISSELNLVNSQLLEQSFLGRTGMAIEPVVKPLGWDWRIGVGVIASFPAREVVIATMGTIYSLGGDVDEENEGLRATLQAASWPDGTPVFSVPVAMSIMVFFALCAQCVSTLMVIRRETNSWRWPAFSFAYMTVLAYIGAFLTYQIGIRL